MEREIIILVLKQRYANTRGRSAFLPRVTPMGTCTAGPTKYCHNRHLQQQKRTLHLSVCCSHVNPTYTSRANWRQNCVSVPSSLCTPFHFASATATLLTSRPFAACVSYLPASFLFTPLTSFFFTFSFSLFLFFFFSETLWHRSLRIYGPVGGEPFPLPERSRKVKKRKRKQLEKWQGKKNENEAAMPTARRGAGRGERANLSASASRAKQGRYTWRAAAAIWQAGSQAVRSSRNVTDRGTNEPYLLCPKAVAVAVAAVLYSVPCTVTTAAHRA